FAFEIVVFILLGLMLDVEFLMLNLDLAFIGLIIAILVIFVARPASVFIVTSADRTMNWKERFFVSWAGVKGVATAALAAIAVATITSATGPAPDGVDFALLGQQINVIIFIVLMVSLIVQGMTTPFLATRLKLIDEHDSATEITIQRNATRHALLLLVDKYTEGKVGSDLYTRLKKELEEEIFTIEDELRKIVTEKKARIQELEIRESILQNKLSFYETEYEKGKLTDSGYEEQKQEIETEIEEISSSKRVIQKGKES
ncbi:MAG: cation:proton antiporter domain-containing protein, partial [Candidatus Thorarchaeota archaeon]